MAAVSMTLKLPIVPRGVVRDVARDVARDAAGGSSRDVPGHPGEALGGSMR